MKAAVIRQHGGYDVLSYEEVADPEPETEDDVIVRVAACALNRLDLFARQGIEGPGIRGFKLPHVSGVDIAGQVVAWGDSVVDLQPGERVLVYPGLFCGKCLNCTRGEETMCENYRIVGEDTWGGLAELVRVPASNIFRLPPEVSFQKAAAAGTAGTTAWRMLVTVGRLRPEERILILGATGGVGTAAVRIARRIGSRILATARTRWKAEKLLEIGVDRPINLEEEEFHEAVMEETGGRGVDLVANPLGGDTWRPAVRSLAPGGKMVICGATIGDNPTISIREIYQAHRQILGAPMGNLRDFSAVLDLLTKGEFEPVIDSVYSLSDIAKAHRHLEERQAFGKILIVPGHDGVQSG